MELLGALYRSGRGRFAVKLGLAGVLALYLALLLGLPEPGWALLTVYVLMLARHVGATFQKAVFRIVGTIVGGFLGYLVTALLQQSPVIFLSLVALIVGVCTALFGQNRYPYAFLLCGLTMLLVCTTGLSDPGGSWMVMLWRIQEIVLGILVVLLVQGLLWPRSAREEFVANTRAAFTDLQLCLEEAARMFFEKGTPASGVEAAEFPARITSLRTLLDHGSRESLAFRARLPLYFELTNCLNRIAEAIVTLGESLPERSAYRDNVRLEVGAVHRALEAALQDLGSRESTTESRRRCREEIDRAFALYDKRVLAIRSSSRLTAYTTEEAFQAGIHGLALEEIRDQIHRAHKLLEALPDNSLKVPVPRLFLAAPTPPIFWVHAGIKAAVAVTAALFLDDWLHPPGGAIFVLGAWTFTSRNATSPGGQGDRRAFHYVVAGAAVFLFLGAVLLATTPFLANYAVLNVVIFTSALVWGYLAYPTRGITIPMKLSLYATAGVVGLNAQKPVPFQAVADLVFGIILAQILAAIIQRLLWPSLPQWELRNRLVEFLRICRQTLDGGNLPLWRRVRLSLIPSEALQRIAILHPPLCPPDEPPELRRYVQILQRIGSRLQILRGQIAPLLSENSAREGVRLTAEFESALCEQLDRHAAAVESADPTRRIDAARLQSLISAWTDWMTHLRGRMLAENLPPEQSLRILGLAGRYVQAARDLMAADEQFARLRLPLYMGDFAL